MNARCLPPVALGLAMILSGCDAPKKTPKGGAAPVESREIIGKTTQNVLKLDEALKDGGKLAATSITSSDPLGVISDAYKTSVAKIGGFAVTQALQMFEIENNRMPKDYDEFMTAIIKKDQPDGIPLPMLPYYQEYAYDEANKKLVVVEFPAKKAQFQKQQDEKLGR